MCARRRSCRWKSVLHICDSHFDYVLSVSQDIAFYVDPSRWTRRRLFALFLVYGSNFLQCHETLLLCVEFFGWEISFAPLVNQNWNLILLNRFRRRLQAVEVDKNNQASIIFSRKLKLKFARWFLFVRVGNCKRKERKLAFSLKSKTIKCRLIANDDDSMLYRLQACAIGNRLRVRKGRP